MFMKLSPKFIYIFKYYKKKFEHFKMADLQSGLPGRELFIGVTSSLCCIDLKF